MTGVIYVIIREQKSPRTRRAYRLDVQHFMRIPSTADPRRGRRASGGEIVLLAAESCCYTRDGTESR
jgi:hypothetical protein